jgi:hypothetical protein
MEKSIPDLTSLGPFLLRERRKSYNNKTQIYHMVIYF